jgi:hypothetical protein
MLGTYFYHEITRKTVIAFGTLFNDIYVRHEDGAGNDISEMKVPVAYGPRQKFLARIQQQPELNKATQITLPRMSFEISSIEQILPFFQPGFTLSVDLVKSIGEKRDIPMVLQSITQQDDYEGDFATRRALIYTLQFTAKTFMFGPIADTPEGLIRKVQLDYYSDTNQQTAKRVQRYTVAAKAKKDYNEDDVIDSKDDPFIEPGDDFGFTESSTFFGDSKDYSPTRKIDL